MDYFSLNRKQLQALCKKHCIPANTTNVAMAEALTALLKDTAAESIENVESSSQQPVSLKKNEKISALADISNTPTKVTRSKRLLSKETGEENAEDFNPIGAEDHSPIKQNASRVPSKTPLNQSRTRGRPRKEQSEITEDNYVVLLSSEDEAYHPVPSSQTARTGRKGQRGKNKLVDEEVRDQTHKSEDIVSARNESTEALEDNLNQEGNADKQNMNSTARRVTRSGRACRASDSQTLPASISSKKLSRRAEKLPPKTPFSRTRKANSVHENGLDDNGHNLERGVENSEPNEVSTEQVTSSKPDSRSLQREMNEVRVSATEDDNSISDEEGVRKSKACSAIKKQQRREKLASTPSTRSSLRESVADAQTARKTPATRSRKSKKVSEVEADNIGRNLKEASNDVPEEEAEMKAEVSFGRRGRDSKPNAKQENQRTELHDKETVTEQSQEGVFKIGSCEKRKSQEQPDTQPRSFDCDKPEKKPGKEDQEASFGNDCQEGSNKGEEIQKETEAEVEADEQKAEERMTKAGDICFDTQWVAIAEQILEMPEESSNKGIYLEIKGKCYEPATLEEMQEESKDGTETSGDGQNLEERRVEGGSQNEKQEEIEQQEEAIDDDSKIGNETEDKVLPEVVREEETESGHEKPNGKESKDGTETSGDGQNLAERQVEGGSQNEKQEEIEQQEEAIDDDSKIGNETEDKMLPEVVREEETESGHEKPNGKEDILREKDKPEQLEPRNLGVQEEPVSKISEYPDTELRHEISAEKQNEEIYSEKQEKYTSEFDATSEVVSMLDAEEYDSGSQKVDEVKSDQKKYEKMEVETHCLSESSNVGDTGVEGVALSKTSPEKQKEKEDTYSEKEGTSQSKIFKPKAASEVANMLQEIEMQDAEEHDLVNQETGSRKLETKSEKGKLEELKLKTHCLSESSDVKETGVETTAQNFQLDLSFEKKSIVYESRTKALGLFTDSSSIENFSGITEAESSIVEEFMEDGVSSQLKAPCGADYQQLSLRQLRAMFKESLVKQVEKQKKKESMLSNSELAATNSSTVSTLEES